MSASDAVTGALVICVFIIGGAIGSLTEKWAHAEDVRTLRQQAHELANSGKVCCDAAYVAIKYRPECPTGAALPTAGAKP